MATHTHEKIMERTDTGEGFLARQFVFLSFRGFLVFDLTPKAGWEKGARKEGNTPPRWGSERLGNATAEVRFRKTHRKEGLLSKGHKRRITKQKVR